MLETASIHYPSAASAGELHEQWVENQIRIAKENRDFPRVTLLKQHLETGRPIHELEQAQRAFFASIREKLWQARPDLAPRTPEEKAWYLEQVNKPLNERTNPHVEVIGV